MTASAGAPREEENRSRRVTASAGASRLDKNRSRHVTAGAGVSRQEGNSVTLAVGGAIRLAIWSSSGLVRPRSLRRLRRS